MKPIYQEYLLEEPLREPQLIWHDVQQQPFTVFGTYGQKNPEFLRMPSEIAKTVSKNVEILHTHTSGVRVRFQTDSPYIAIRAELPSPTLYNHMPQISSAGFDLYAMRADGFQYAGTFIYRQPRKDFQYEAILNTGGGCLCEYLINFPLYSPVKNLNVGLKQGSIIQKCRAYQNNKPVIFYGSSITQGACASRPGNCYQNFLSRKLDMDYINLGFSGSCLAEQSMAEYISGLDMAVFVCDYDHNAPDPAYLERTHAVLYETVRKRQPLLPYIMLSRPNPAKDPQDSRKRLNIIRATYDMALSRGDQNVYLIDGAHLFEGDQWDACTVDGGHPNDLGFYRMAKAIEPVLSYCLKHGRS